MYKFFPATAHLMFCSLPNLLDLHIIHHVKYLCPCEIKNSTIIFLLEYKNLPDRDKNIRKAKLVVVDKYKIGG
jgi:hypothetical protein